MSKYVYFVAFKAKGQTRYTVTPESVTMDGNMETARVAPITSIRDIGSLEEDIKEMLEKREPWLKDIVVTVIGYQLFREEES